MGILTSYGLKFEQALESMIDLSSVSYKPVAFGLVVAKLQLRLCLYVILYCYLFERLQ